MGAFGFFRDTLKRTRIIPRIVRYSSDAILENKSRKNLLNDSMRQALKQRKNRLFEQGIRLGLKDNPTNNDISRMREIKSEIDSINSRLGKAIT